MRVPVSYVTGGKVSRRDGYIVVVMRFYPRFIAKGKRDEYVPQLAPDEILFSEFKEEERRGGNHDAAFAQVRYAERFALSPAGLEELRRLAALSKDKNIYLICQCALDQCCHADLLILMARQWYGAFAMSPRYDYRLFKERLQATTPENPGDLLKPVADS